MPSRTIELPTVVGNIKKIRFENYDMTPVSPPAPAAAANPPAPAPSATPSPSPYPPVSPPGVSPPGSSPPITPSDRSPQSSTVSDYGPLAKQLSPSLHLSPPSTSLDSSLDTTLQGLGVAREQLKAVVAQIKRKQTKSALKTMSDEEYLAAF